MRPGPAVTICIYSAGGQDRYRSGRTVRSVQGCDARLCDLVWSRPAEALKQWNQGDAVWFLRAGAWSLRLPPRWPRPSATGLPLVAWGAVRDAQSGTIFSAHTAESERAELDGDSCGASSYGVNPPPASVYLEAPLAARVLAQIGKGETPAQALAGVIASGGHRRVHACELDVLTDQRLRLLQLVTSLQQGGAERLTLDLAEQLQKVGIVCRVAALGRPTRRAFAAPSGALDWSAFAGNREVRADRMAQWINESGIDLVHAHLIDGAEVQRLTVRQVPLAVTVHNQRPGWPACFAHGALSDVALLAACSIGVAEDLQSAALVAPVRTVWNGVCFSSFRPNAATDAAARRLRAQWSIPQGDLVLLAIANPRPQKRLERLPEILVALQSELERRSIARAVHLVIVGEASNTSAAAAESLEALNRAIERCPLRERILLAGAHDDIPAILAAGDGLLSTSAHEGLSLALLEALAANRWAIITDCGGARDVAQNNPACRVLPLEASPDDFATVAADWAQSSPASGAAASERHFTRGRMAERYRWLYPRAIARTRQRARPRGLLLVTNNFSIGGAQSSARRLLVGLASQGVPVRAATLQEEPDEPTPGRAALQSAGIDVCVLPSADRNDPADGVAELLLRIDADPPQSILFWNALTQSKVLLADALFDTPIFDVSPGEMYYDSLHRYLANPRPGLPYRTARDYGRRLSGVIVKYAAERERADCLLGAPVYVIPNGIPVAPHAAPQSTRSLMLRIGTAVRLHPQKRLEDLFVALHVAHPRLPDYELQIAGGMERGCQEYVDRLQRASRGLPVRWLGAVDNMPAFLRNLDLFVMISEPAGCPNALLEALSAGLPTVATDVGGASEQVVDGVTGRLTPRGDARALAQALVEVANDSRRHRFGDAARRHLADHFSLDRMLQRYRQLCLPTPDAPQPVGERAGGCAPATA